MQLQPQGRVTPMIVLTWVQTLKSKIGNAQGILLWEVLNKLFKLAFAYIVTKEHEGK